MKRKVLYTTVVTVFVILLLCMSGCSNSEKAEAPVVKANTGTYTGKVNDGVQEFLGIRYADTAQRWKAPTDVKTTADDEIAATEWGPCCTQPYNEVEIASQGELSEDCLNLNIWTKDVATQGKPVMVFIHGGGFMNGGSNDPMYYGDTMVRNLAETEDMVFVSINYRTNIFGSIDLSGLEGYTDEYADAINLWALDQKQALKWINENIEAFGGDTENITLVGQSCGGMSIAYMLAMDDATKYFQKAVIESGAPFIAQISKEKKAEVADMIFKTAGVKTLDEFLALSDEEIKEKYLGDIFDNMQGLSDIYADGNIIPTDWWDKIRLGSADGIKIMIGSTSGENDWAAFDYENMPAALKNEQDIWDWYIAPDIEKKGGTDTKYLINPVAKDGTPSFDLDAFLATDKDKVKAMTDLYNAMSYVQGTEYMAEALSEYTDTYLYYWTYAPEPATVAEYCEANDLTPETSPYGRPLHAMDLLFAFGTTEEGYQEISGDPAKLPEKLSPMAQAAWYNFAKNGDPNNDLIPEWKKYDKSKRETMVMDEEWSLQSDPRKAQREAFTCRPQDEK